MPSVCKQRLSKKIGINLHEGYTSRAQAIAVAYSQVNKEYPHCRRFLQKSPKKIKKSAKKSAKKSVKKTKKSPGSRK